MTGSMQRALDEMTRRRGMQQAYNVEHGVVPRSIVKSVIDIRFVTRVADARGSRVPEAPARRPADAAEREALISLLESQMQAAAEALDFEQAALLRDQLLEIKAELEPRGGRRAPARGRTQPVR